MEVRLAADSDKIMVSWRGGPSDMDAESDGRTCACRRRMTPDSPTYGTRVDEINLAAASVRHETVSGVWSGSRASSKKRR